MTTWNFPNQSEGVLRSRTWREKKNLISASSFLVWVRCAMIAYKASGSLRETEAYLESILKEPGNGSTF